MNAEWLAEHRSVIVTVSSFLLIAGFLIVAARGSQSRNARGIGGSQPTVELNAHENPVVLPEETRETSSDVVAFLPPSDAEMASGHVGARPSLFVFPVGVSAEAEHEQHLADELHDDIVAALSRSADIAVIGRKAREPGIAVSQSVRSLQREVGARYALYVDLSVRDSQSRFSVNILETAAGSSMWSKHFDVAASTQSCNGLLVNQVAGSVATEVLRAEAERTLRQEPEQLSAESLINRARHTFTAFNRRTFHEIEHQARMAIDLKPRLPGGYGILAGAMALKAHQAWTESPGEDLDEAFSEGSRAIELSPDNPRMLYWWGHVHFYGGRTDDAISILEKAAAGDPSYVATHILHGAALIMAGHPSQGNARIDHALELNPGHAQAFQAQLWRGIGHFECEDTASAHEAFLASINQNVIKNPTDSAATFWAWYGTAAAYCKRGLARESDAIQERLRQRFTGHDYSIMLEHAEESFAPNLKSLKMLSAIEKNNSLVDLDEHRPKPKPMSLRNIFRRRAATGS